MHPITSSAEKKPKVDLRDTEDDSQHLFGNKVASLRDKGIEIVEEATGDTGEKVVPELSAIEDGEDAEFVEVSGEEIQVIETLEELETALDDVLAPIAVQQVFKPQVIVPFSLNSLVEQNHILRNCSVKIDEKRFMARISPDDAAAAEAELSRQITQSDFEKVYN